MKYLNPRLVIVTVLAVLAAPTLLRADQSMDSEFSALAETLTGQVKEAGKKKLSVVDFTDLQGNFNELGRFVAEELTIKMISHRKEFSMVDRSNLKRILAEHKLSMSGLINPENAKKLGQISGVDAIVIGNVVPLADSVELTAKIIATDTAEIIGAGKARISSGPDIMLLLGKGLAENFGDSGIVRITAPPGRDFTCANAVQKFGDFQVELVSFRVFKDQRAFAAFQIVNLTSNGQLGVGLNTFGEWYGPMTYSGAQLSAKIIDENGLLLRGGHCDGIPLFYCGSTAPKDNFLTGFEKLQASLRQDPPMKDWDAKMGEIGPGQALRFTLEFAPSKRSQGTDPQHPTRLGTVFKLQAELITVLRRQGSAVKPKLSNVFLDGISPTERDGAK